MQLVPDNKQRPLRVVLTKVGLDGHDRGVKVIAQALRDAGMEVIYAGLRRTPEDIARIVLEEDADVLGLSILSGAVVPLTRRVLEALHAQQVNDVVLVVGGIVPEPAREELKSLGVQGVFTPGTSLTQIVAYIRASVPAERSYQEAK
ncbi:cobalamin B12-binding domain-containing protein [Ramlibacter sp. G-1-2-2]|uniref:Cobalamin B12-binding domain-containing protein n=1 Tax=Ramlibacter agri TaxID=2728837 RepID=A0A848H4J8_9BURK|nr:cobalamin B12-binding domain-containing protein [Ramlibacter agri]NML45725.1 cobalamin B12-binding domain-containing protein [Ramlibacter agri]